MKLRSGALRMGMSGEEVRALHRELAQLGYAIPEDESRASLFGSATRQAVVEFQQAQALGADGVVGPKTAERLDAELARRRVAAGDAAKPAAGDGPRDYVIHGKVRQKDGRPAARLDVRAFGVDAEGREELLGNSPSDEAGQYKITYGEDLFLRLRGNRAALRVKMRVFDGARGMHAEWNVMPVSQPNHTLDLEVDWPAAPRPEAKSLRVRGRVSRADGSQLVNLSVRAFDKDLRSEELLGTAALDKEGRYDIGYDASQFRRAEKKSADLIVRVFNHQGKELAASPVRFNAREVETIDIVIGAPRQQSEFGALVALLTPLLDGATLAELSDADVDFLTGETEVGRELVAAVVAAERMAELTQLPAAAFSDYMARRRAGASGDEEEFWNRPEAEGGLPKTEVERFRFVAQAGEVVRYEKTPVSALLELRARKEIFAAIDLALWDADGWLKLARRAWPDKPAGKLQEAAEELAGRAAQVFPASLVEGRLVSGRVTTRAGRPGPGVAVQALHRGPHAGAAVAISAPVRTDAGGLYRLAVDRRVSLQLISPASLRLQVRASAEEDPSKPGLSDVVPAAELPVTLNVTLPLEVGPTEYERVFERLRAAVPDASLASLDKEEVLKWLARASSIDAETVGRFHEAQRLAQQSLKISDTQTAKIPAEVHYALLHPVARDIAGGPARTAERLRAAVGAWVVRKEVNASAQVAEAWLSYREVEERERRLGARAAAGQPATVADILTAAGLSADDLNRYVRILARATGSDDIELLFESADISDAGRATIRRANKLAHFVGADPTLVGLLIKEVSTTADDEQAVGKLAARPAAEWERLFREAGLNGDVGELRRRARAVEAALEADNPSAALRGRLEAWKDAAGFAPLRDFLKSNEGVNLRGRGLKFQEFNLDAATPEDGAALRRDLGSLQRLARVSSFSQALQLFEYGYTSARDIASQTLEGFVGRVTGGAGRFNFNADEAAEVYRRARRQYAAALVVAVGLSPHYQGLSPAATGSVWRGNGQPTDDTKPDYRADLKTLFGTADACAVKPCQSVLGQPAYFVDLLQLLDGSGTNANPLDVLFTRRRDLGELKLSCENAETLLPYIDLVIELLERDAVQLGGGTPIAQPRYPQTTRGTDDLAAYPEHLEEKAYDNLAGAVFPWALPFSLETEEAAVYLNDLGLTREELMRPLRRRAPHGWQEPEASEIASASLGISRVEREVI
ncbi:MAG TPA: peptidoglycan-binding protein, partial [Pyrinomonadaceae bacterium]|nr:peptidoglycan-binding protein [Pyrinomonadaceae bacterium]